MIECTLHSFHEWLNEQGWPNEVILHSADFVILQSRLVDNERRTDERGEYFWCGGSCIRPREHSPARILDVSKERLFG